MSNTFYGDLLEEMNSRSQQLDSSLKMLRKTGTELAQAERDYKMVLNETVMRMKAEKQPATLISLMVYGDKEVAKARFDRDVKKTVYEANKESINVQKLTLRILADQWEKEFGNG